MDNSRFHMWRAMVALTKVDHHIDDAEVETLQAYFDKIQGTDEQHQQLRDDLKSPPDLDAMLSQVTEPGHRSQIVYYARILFHSDGDFHVEEEKALKALHTKAMANVDLKASLREVEEVTKDFWAAHREYEAQKNWRQRLVEAVMFWDKNH